MSTGPKISLGRAQVLAAKIVQALEPGCVRIAIAGSVRRQKPEIGDIEIVAIPKPSVDLFGNPTNGETELDRILDDLIGEGRLTRGRCDGAKYKQLGISASPGLNLDLFCTNADCWPVVYAIRTGPSDFSRLLVTQRSKGGYLPDGLRVEEGRVKKDGGDVMEIADESEFLALTVGRWIEPSDRNVGEPAHV